MARSSRSKILRRNKAIKRVVFNDDFNNAMKDAAYERHTSNIEAQRERAIAEATEQGLDLGVHKIDVTQITPENTKITAKINKKQNRREHSREIRRTKSVNKQARKNNREHNVEVFNVPLAKSVEIDL